MARYRRKKKRKNKFLYAFLLVILLFAYSIYMYGFEETFGLDYETIQTFLSNRHSDNNTLVSGNLTVSFLDVGQADAILIQNGDKNMLIDAGNNNDGELLVQYFKELMITHFDIVVGTHPHEDHIGGLDDVIDEFDVSQFYMPDVITNTTTFLDVLNALEKKNMKLNIPKVGDIWILGDAKIEVLYTGTNQKDLNGASIVLKLTYGNVKFLFTGDATASIEKEILKKDVSADVLKVAHHGSPYSTTDSFLDACSPRYAVISVGNNNNYGHPGTSTIQKFERKQIEVHRTDKEGTVVATTDGNDIHFSSFDTNVNGG